MAYLRDKTAGIDIPIRASKKPGFTYNDYHSYREDTETVTALLNGEEVPFVSIRGSHVVYFEMDEGWWRVDRTIFDMMDRNALQFFHRKEKKQRISFLEPCAPIA